VRNENPPYFPLYKRGNEKGDLERKDVKI